MKMDTIMRIPWDQSSVLHFYRANSFPFLWEKMQWPNKITYQDVKSSLLTFSFKLYAFWEASPYWPRGRGVAGAPNLCDYRFHVYYNGQTCELWSRTPEFTSWLFHLLAVCGLWPVISLLCASVSPLIVPILKVVSIKWVGIQKHLY